MCPIHEQNVQTKNDLINSLKDKIKELKEDKINLQEKFNDLARTHNKVVMTNEKLVESEIKTNDHIANLEKALKEKCAIIDDLKESTSDSELHEKMNITLFQDLRLRMYVNFDKIFI